MKGLMIKDLRIILSAKIAIMLFVILGVWNTLASKSSDTMIGISGLLVVMFSVLTCALDESNKSMEYYFTMPIDRNMYVIEKYVFTLVLEVVTLIASSVFWSIIPILRGYMLSPSDILTDALMTFAGCTFLAAIILGGTILFSSKYSRLVIILVSVVGVTICSLSSTVFEKYGVSIGENVIQQICDYIDRYPERMIAVAIVAALIMYIISFVISIIAINRKEF